VAVKYIFSEGETVDFFSGWPKEFFLGGQLW